MTAEVSRPCETAISAVFFEIGRHPMVPSEMPRNELCSSRDPQ